MSDDGLIQLFITQYKTLLKMRLQQKTSMLRGMCEEGNHTGSKLASPINLVDAMTMRTPAGRFAPKSAAPQGYTRRWVSPIDKVGEQYVDNLDQLKTPIDPKSQLIERAAAAVARQYDDELIAAATRAAVIGADAGSLSTEAFPVVSGAFQVPSDFGSGSTSTGLSVAKINYARQILEHYHNVEELNAGGGVLVIGSQQHADLRNQALVTSSEFNQNGGVLNKGYVTEYMGFKIVVSERLPTITDVNSHANTRGCLAFVKSGLYLGLWQEIKTEVLRRPDLEANPWDISTTVSFGGTRTELGKIIQICAADTTGADITA